MLRVCLSAEFAVSGEAIVIAIRKVEARVRSRILVGVLLKTWYGSVVELFTSKSIIVLKSEKPSSNDMFIELGILRRLYNYVFRSRVLEIFSS